MYENPEKPNASFLHGSRQKDSVAAILATVTLVVKTGCVARLYDDPCTPCLCPIKPVDRAEFYGDYGIDFAHHRCGRDDLYH